ncbi:hypothetical protein JTB14_007366 [Gonioctena quinquepunctata]|nr:hypothetical protein JTB14_007366 [Gonioctena quinquepunctata]
MEIIIELDSQLLYLMLEDETQAEDIDAETSRADEISRQRLYPLEIEIDEEPFVRNENMRKRFESEEINNEKEKPQSNTSEDKDFISQEELSTICERRPPIVTRYAREVKPPAKFGS